VRFYAPDLRFYISSNVVEIRGMRGLPALLWDGSVLDAGQYEACEIFSTLIEHS